MHNKTICIDLDGTICQYTEWKGETHFGHVIKGAKDALSKLKKNGHTIIIFTTRNDKKLVAEFLKHNNIPFDYINENPIQPDNAIGGKLIADIYVDDRGLTFNGDWEKTVEDIETFKPWEESQQKDTEILEYAKDYLSHDFEQCFQQMRHYDVQSWDIVKFCFGEVLLAITAIWALYCYCESPQHTNSLISSYYNWLMLSILGISYLFVFISSYLVSRNRVYYVKTAIYINEFRKLALDKKPYGFCNMYNYYNNYDYPKVNECKSTQLVSLYALFLLGICLAGLCGGIVTWSFPNFPLWSKILIFIGILIMGYLPLHIRCIHYLKKEDRKLKK